MTRSSSLRSLPVAALGAAAGLLVVGGCDGSDPAEPNTPPAVSIESPQTGAVFAAGATVVFRGSGTDEEDGALTGEALRWSSGIDGELGSTGTLSVGSLSVGTHQITLTGTDAEGAERTASITIEVVEPVERIAALRETAAGVVDVVTMDRDGGAVTVVTEGAAIGAVAPEGGPAWGPGGVWLAFAAAPAGQAEGCEASAIHTIRADGSDLRKISTPGAGCPRDLDPTWSPAGQYLAFCRVAADGIELVVQTPAGEEVGGLALTGEAADTAGVAERPRPGCGADWSPGGRYLLFDDVHPGTSYRQVVVWDLNDNSFFTLSALADDANNAMGSWSPDGNSLTFASDQEGSWDVYVLTLQSNELRPLAAHAATDVEPTWSPGSSQVAFQSDRSGGSADLYRVDRDGTGLVPVTVEGPADAVYRAPDWLGVGAPAGSPGPSSTEATAPGWLGDAFPAPRVRRAP